jgi:hypothetical protein
VDNGLIIFNPVV